MAEALAVVGIVASIVQLADFGSRVLKRLEEYQSQVGDVPETFHHIKAELPVLLDALRQTEFAIGAGSTQQESKQAFLPLTLVNEKFSNTPKKQIHHRVVLQNSHPCTRDR